MVLAIRADTEAVQTVNAKLAAEHARLDQEHTVLAAEVERLTEQNERLDDIIAVLRRAQFGRKSERIISNEQMALALEEVETAFSAKDAVAEEERIARREGVNNRRANRDHLPSHRPCEKIVIEPEAKACPCCGSVLDVIGEDVSERLDKIPVRPRVIVTRRPKYACRACTDGVVQAPAPSRLIPGGLPTVVRMLIPTQLALSWLMLAVTPAS